MAKFNDKQRKNIIAAVANGESKRSLARKYGVSDTTIRKICDADPDMVRKCAQKKAENIASVLSHMDSQKGKVCQVLDAILERLASPINLDAATLPQLATALGILVDKYTNHEVADPASGAKNNLFDAIVGGAEEDVGTDEIPELK